jgi:hypothetical protein
MPIVTIYDASDDGRAVTVPSERWRDFVLLKNAVLMDEDQEDMGEEDVHVPIPHQYFQYVEAILNHYEDAERLYAIVEQGRHHHDGFIECVMAMSFLGNKEALQALCDVFTANIQKEVDGDVSKLPGLLGCVDKNSPEAETADPAFVVDYEKIREEEKSWLFTIDF